MLSVLSILLPALSSLFISLGTRDWARRISLASVFLSMILVVLEGFLLKPTAEMQHVFQSAWMSSAGIMFYFGMDSITWVMLLLSNLAAFVSVLLTEVPKERNPKLVFALILAMQALMNGAFLSIDLFVYYVFWELSLIPAFFLLLLWGNGKIQKTTLKFFLYTLAGSLFMLAAIIWLGISGPTIGFGLEKMMGLTLPHETQVAVFVAFMVAYAVKIPIFPFHTWQAETYSSAPIPLTILLAGVMLKMALYSMVRWVIPIVPDAMLSVGPVFLWLAVFGIVYASVIALKQTEIKKLFAWSSMAHVGLIAAGILTASPDGLKGAVLQMLAHTINALAFLMGVHLLSKWKKAGGLADFGGVRNMDPFFGGLFLLFVFSFISVPFTAGFPGEVMLLSSLFHWNEWSSFLAGLAMILGAVYMLKAYQLLMLGPANPEFTQYGAFQNPMSLSDKLLMLALATLILFLGLFPQRLLEWIDNPIQNILNTN